MGQQLRAMIKRGLLVAGGRAIALLGYSCVGVGCPNVLTVGGAWAFGHGVWGAVGMGAVYVWRAMKFVAKLCLLQKMRLRCVPPKP